MTANQRYFAKLQFRTRVLEASGNAYEALFCEIQEGLHPTFTRVKPAGKVGDRGNDGYRKGYGHFHQVYAPENPTDTISEAVAKAKKDFNKLKSYWDAIEPVQHYAFTFNDKFLGSNPLVETALHDIQSTHGLASSETHRAKHLEDDFLKLSSDDMQQIIGFVPSEEVLEELDVDELHDMVRRVSSALIRLDEKPGMYAPDFEQKIEFNGLSTAPSDWLKMGSYNSGDVRGVFSGQSDISAKDIQLRMRQLYVDLRQHASTMSDIEDSERADVVFFMMLNRLSVGFSRHRQTAALSLMAFYFETCDIFEEPS